MKNEEKEKKSAIDPTDPRQAAFVGGGITGAVAGATVGGAVAGPVGAVVGATVAGLGGAKLSERIQIDLAAEEHHWEQNWKQRPYASSFSNYEDLAPAYRAGYDLSEDVYADSEATFEDMEPHLRENYESSGPSVPWDSARPAAQDAFERVTQGRNDKLAKDR